MQCSPGAAADDDHVVVVHCRQLSAGSARAPCTAAYQSGQFASRCPVRFSCCPWAAAARRSALARSLADANVVVPGRRARAAAS